MFFESLIFSAENFNYASAHDAQLDENEDTVEGVMFVFHFTDQKHDKCILRFLVPAIIFSSIEIIIPQLPLARKWSWWE